MHVIEFIFAGRTHILGVIQMLETGTIQILNAQGYFFFFVFGV